MRILVCGDRNWKNKIAILEQLKQYPRETIIIEGEANGADKLGRIVAQELGMFVEQYPADWNTYGKSAGIIRNKQMLDEGKPDLVLAFHNDIENSKGTKNMVEQATKKGLVVKLIKE